MPDKIKRAFLWLRKAMQITEKTTLPGKILDEIRPTIDLFGWEQLAGLVGVGPRFSIASGAAASDAVLLPVTPEGVMRYVIHASCSHPDPIDLIMSIQIRAFGSDTGIAQSIVAMAAAPQRFGLAHPVLLRPGELLLARSSPAPAVGLQLSLRMIFVDIEPGEYIRPL